MPDPNRYTFARAFAGEAAARGFAGGPGAPAPPEGQDAPTWAPSSRRKARGGSAHRPSAQAQRAAGTIDDRGGHAMARYTLVAEVTIVRRYETVVVRDALSPEEALEGARREALGLSFELQEHFKRTDRHTRLLEPFVQGTALSDPEEAPPDDGDEGGQGGEGAERNG